VYQKETVGHAVAIMAPGQRRRVQERGTGRGRLQFWVNAAPIVAKASHPRAAGSLCKAMLPLPIVGRSRAGFEELLSIGDLEFRVAWYWATCMSLAIHSAYSGMRAATLRLEASAYRVATAGAARVRPVGGSPVYVLTPVDQTADAGPVRPVSPVTPAVQNSVPVWMAAYQGGGDVAGTAVKAEVDLAAEAFEQASARASFLANAKTLQITQDMVKQLFELDA
jgi:flagellar basal body rod protein FlgC